MTTTNKHINRLEKIEKEAQKYALGLKDPTNSNKLWRDYGGEWEDLTDHIKKEHPAVWDIYCQSRGRSKHHTFSDLIDDWYFNIKVI